MQTDEAEGWFFNTKHNLFLKWQQCCIEENDGFACAYCLDSFIKAHDLSNSETFCSPTAVKGWEFMSERNC
ncbi:hypothetical protein QKT49_gp377 [Acanthamoeba castellanii medusavirus]|uniref:Uncharacterized protein n=1 Tax=Acanthamoeba castellanii medusavirus J1 TaxID=3114988 RepID=A0A3T1CX35_9VIRU|nr:hypothetical protein QKT49_gp377 [Acanthamoeba castellanii medusavirus]BBI30386.1 hypothetical protein [Acanthamoeba castellanii medusavirus J1]